MSICENPIFMVGSPGSGTPTVSRSLAEHSDLCSSGAVDTTRRIRAFGEMTRPLPNNKLPQHYAPNPNWITTDGVGGEDFFRLLGQCLSALSSSTSGGKRWIDQTPAIIHMTTVLAKIFPGASFLHILRDGRSVVQAVTDSGNGADGEIPTERFSRSAKRWASSWRRHRRKILSNVPGPISERPESFKAACRTWSRHSRLSMAFAEAHPERCLTVRYEELVAEPEEGFRDIFRFIAVPFEEAPITYFRSHRINSSFPGRWREGVPDPWSEWSAEEKLTFLEEAGATMVSCGLVTQEELRQLEADAARDT